MLGVLHQFGYIGMSAVIFGEVGTMVFFLPGDTLIFSAGLLSQIGVFNYWVTIGYVFCSSVIAGHFGYFLGTKLNRNTLLHNKFYRINEDHLLKTEKFFEKYGFWAIALSRFVPVVRNLISQLCGLIKYDKKKFFFANLLASIIWPLVIVTLGFYFGKMFPNLVRWAEVAMLFVVMIIALPFFFEVGKKIVRRRNQGVPEN
jgi:membrane-associated protein